MSFIRSMEQAFIYGDAQPRQDDRAQEALQLLHGAFFPATEIFEILTRISPRECVQRFMQKSPPANLLGGESRINQNVAVEWLLPLEACVFNQIDCSAPI